MKGQTLFAILSPKPLSPPWDGSILTLTGVRIVGHDVKGKVPSLTIVGNMAYMKDKKLRRKLRGKRKRK